MIEKQIKDNYRLGLQRGILELDDCFYMPVRITGTGLSLRKEEGKTIVADRQKVDFCSPAFLEHAKTLPILCEHPKEGMLTPDNLKNNPIIGNCIDAWIQQDEVWGLARVFDKSLLDKLGKEINSTSPAVWIGYEQTCEDGIKKENPVTVNHLAFVSKGHWDIGDSIGYDNSKIETIVEKNDDIISEKENLKEGVKMAEELKTAVDAEVKADEGETVTVEAKPAEEAKTEEVKAEEVEADTEETVKEVSDEEVEELSDEEEAEEIVDEDDEKPVEISADEAETEVIDDEVETKEDKARDEAVDEMRATCDSAHDSLGVKMPVIKGRQTVRSVVNKFVQANRSFVDSKYANLAVDSYTSELAQEVLDSTLANIRKESAKLETKKEGFVDTGKGYSSLSNFGWRS